MNLFNEEMDDKNEYLAQQYSKNFLKSDGTKAVLNQYVMQKVHEYKAGDYFGEKALQDTKPRAATILTTSDCHFGTLTKDEYIKCL